MINRWQLKKLIGALLAEEYGGLGHPKPCQKEYNRVFPNRDHLPCSVEALNPEVEDLFVKFEGTTSFVAPQFQEGDRLLEIDLETYAEESQG